MQMAHLLPVLDLEFNGSPRGSRQNFASEPHDLWLRPFGVNSVHLSLASPAQISTSQLSLW